MEDFVSMIAILVISLGGIGLHFYSSNRSAAIRQAEEAGVQPDLSLYRTPRMLYVAMVLSAIWLAGTLIRTEMSHRAHQDALAQVSAQSETNAWVVEAMESCSRRFGTTPTTCAASVLTIADSRGDRKEAEQAIIAWSKVSGATTGLEGVELHGR